MIHIIDGLNADRFPNLLDEVFKLRAKTFHDRLGWDVNVCDGRETDAFDRLHPAHVVSVDSDGEVVGCMRLLQTTGPHMLSDVFYDILDGQPPLRATTLWEATRFCVDFDRIKANHRSNSVSRVTSEIMIGAFEYAQKAGVTDAVAVIDPVMNRLMIKSGNAPNDYLGTPKDMGRVMAMAALMDCSDRRIKSLRDFSGINGNVFLSEERAELIELFHHVMEDVA